MKPQPPRVLILSFYFRPDLSAGSFRTTALVAALRERAAPGTQIEVLTTLPNRYHSFSAEAAECETDGDLTITRIALPPHRSDFVGQARAFLRFARAASRYAARHDFDVVFATSSRLMTAALGAWIARRRRAPLYLDIRDIFVETIGDVLPRVLRPLVPLVRAVFSGIERWTVSAAARVNLVSRGFEPYFSRRYPRQIFSWFTNGVDEEFILPPPDSRAPGTPPLVLYAGNMGESQALHHVLPGLAVDLRDRARFLVIGDGGRRAQLEAALAAAGATNVELRTPLPRAELIAMYRAADVLFLHLGNQPAFERVLPSKLFEYAALGKPVLAGVGGYAASFVREEIDNAAVFAPCDVAGGVRAFESLTIADTPRPSFVEKYRRANIAARIADDILGILPARPS
jgi:glycosyltransferase involved in cell wall biosynthesis